MTHHDPARNQATAPSDRDPAAPREDTPVEGDQGQPVDPDKPKEPNMWLRDGADAPDAADIEDPETQL